MTELAEATGVDLEGVRSAVAALATAGWLDLDDTGRVAGAAGLSLATGPHGLTLGEAPFRTWCAYDALEIAAALEADGLIETACGWCQAPISVAMHGGTPGRTGPEWLWLAEGGDDLRGSFCTPTVLLCSEEHAAAWAEAQGGRGRKLDLAEGARQGAADWARLRRGLPAIRLSVTRRRAGPQLDRPGRPGQPGRRGSLDVAFGPSRSAPSGAMSAIPSSVNS